MPDTYLKLNDALPEHRKIVAAGGDAAWLHVCALAYASRNLTDGFVPSGMVPRLSDRKNPTKLAARLVEVGLWHSAGHSCPRCPQPAAGEYLIHDYLVHQRSAAKVEEIKAKRAVAGSRGGAKKAANAKAATKTQGKQTPSNLLDAEEAGEQENAVTKRSTPSGNKTSGRVSTTKEVVSSKSDKTKKDAGSEVGEPGNLLEGWQPVVVANGTPDTEAEVVLRTTHTDKTPPPPAGAAQPHPDAEVTARTILGEWIDRCQSRPPGQVIGQIGKHVKAMLDEGIHPDDIRRGLATWMTRRIAASHLPGVVNDVMNAPALPRVVGGHQPYRNPSDQSVYYEDL